MKTKLRPALAAALLCAGLAAPALAQGPDPVTAIPERLKALYPATTFGALAPTPWDGVYEVALGNQLAYVDASGRFFLFGHLYDMQAQRDLTAERKDLMARIDFASLPLADAIREVRGNGERTFAIFSDPDCPHCRKLEADLRGLTDATLYTFLMPLASIHPDARTKAIAVWCHPDRLAAWHALMWTGVANPARDCAHPVDRNVALGDRLGITGTPTLIAPDGRVLAGAAGLAQVEAWLARSAASTDR